jgi:uncharacterized repeat protein (TIGR04076 family)
MQFRDLKVKITKVKSSWCECRAGTEFEVRDGRLFLPQEGLCLFALGSLLPCLTAAAVVPNPENDFLDMVSEIRCPDPFAVVKFKIEPLVGR